MNPWDELNSLAVVDSLSAQIPVLCMLDSVSNAAVRGTRGTNGGTNGKCLWEHAVSLCGFSAAIASALHLVYEVCVCLFVCLYMCIA